MNKPPRSRMLIFLFLAVAIAAGMQVVDRFLVNVHEQTPSASPRVSRVDIRRAVSMPVSEAGTLLDEQTSFINTFAKRNINLLVFDVPLQLRIGNPVYLEYDEFQFNELQSLIWRAHEAGLEVGLNPVITGNLNLLKEPTDIHVTYNMFEEWLHGALRLRADAIYFPPPTLAKNVSTTALLSTIEKAYETYSGHIYINVDFDDRTLVELYYKQVRGFIVHVQSPVDLILHDNLWSGLEGQTEFIFDMRDDSRTAAIFEPYLTSTVQQSTINISEICSQFATIEARSFFGGVITPAIPKAETSQVFEREISVWYKHLKNVSRERAFGNAPGFIM